MFSPAHTVSNTTHRHIACFPNYLIKVLGKSGKYRTVYIGRSTSKALWQYLWARRAKSHEPLFTSKRGTSTSEALTRSGILQLFDKLGHEANVQGVRCSPHTFRHTSALMFLRNGGNVFTIKEILGHTSLAICNRYVAIAQADIGQQQRRFSPTDNLKVTGSIPIRPTFIKSLKPVSSTRQAF